MGYVGGSPNNTELRIKIFNRNYSYHCNVIVSIGQYSADGGIESYGLLIISCNWSSVDPNAIVIFSNNEEYIMEHLTLEIVDGYYLSISFPGYADIFAYKICAS